MVFPQRGGIGQIYTEICFGLGRERFAMKNSGSFLCVSAAELWNEVLQLGTALWLGAALQVWCLLWHMCSLCYKAPCCWKGACLSLFFYVLIVFCFSSFSRYESPNIALRCGIMLRECIRHEPLAKIILFSEQFRDFFKYVEMSTFDIASDAFATFKVNHLIAAS